MANQSGNLSGTGLPPTSPSSTTWSTTDKSMGNYAHENFSESKNPDLSEMGFIQGFSNPMTKKVTRDGQIAKRRGPKPDSKPAQTRRQELNRQAQRTHRERKEQYIKALENEVSHLRELFTKESQTVQSLLKYKDKQIRDRDQENYVLREILTSRGIQFEGELQRKSGGASRTPGSQVMSPNLSVPQSNLFRNTVSPTPLESSGFSFLQEPSNFSNGAASSSSGHSPMGTHHSNSPPELQVQEQGPMVLSDPPMPDIPGIFEQDPQLGIDFILALEESCRDHGEYLVRRSVNSPNEADAALFSGHALMATCPPPSHIERTPAEKGGLQPTYPHQAPQVSIEALNKLLNLSRLIKREGYVEGGQVTPIMALQSLRGHSGYPSLTREDIVEMVASIRSKVRCYGFGAVMEDFELRDALTAMFATKPESYESFENDLTTEIDEMYS